MHKQQQLIYFDNAATTMRKPDAVVQAVSTALQTFGGVGRGVHGPALAASMAVYEAREQVAQVLGAASPACIAFAANATEALNIAIGGLIHSGDHAITTAAAHNSVLRPLYRAEQQGSSLSIAPIEPDGTLDHTLFESLFRANTRVAVIPHASNLTGDVYDIELLASICHKHDALIVVDAAQTAGAMLFNMQALDLDVVAFTGHKSLYGPQGTGGLAIAPHVQIEPYLVGGSGSHSHEKTHPTVMPDRLEAGTLNGHGLAGLSAGIAYIQSQGVDTIEERIESLTERFLAGIAYIEGLTILGGGSEKHCGIVALTLDPIDSSSLADSLYHEFAICTRAGSHCAPLMHDALKTTESGAVRFSFSWNNTEEEIDAGIAALVSLALRF